MMSSNNQASNVSPASNQLIVDFPSSSVPNLKSVRFVSYCEVKLIGYTSRSEMKMRWYSEQDFTRFRKALTRDAVQCSIVMRDVLADEHNRSSYKDFVNYCIGLEPFIYIYKKSIGKTLTNATGLGMREVVGDFTGKQLGATFFRGSTPIDAVWATPDVDIVGACVMPCGFGVGDHRLFVIDIRTESIVGERPPRVIRNSSCCKTAKYQDPARQGPICGPVGERTSTPPGATTYSGRSC
jgi:hypothetical protein